MNQKLTIVVVTQPGREELFQRSLIKIVESLYLYPEMEAVIVLNGQSSIGAQTATQFQDLFPQRVTLVSFDENLSLPGRTWEALSKLDLSWVHFPGDDDLVVPSAYQSFFNLENKNGFSALAFNAECIDISDNLLGRKLTPFIAKPNMSRKEALWLALHQPPFVWPALIFDFRVPPTPVFQSRYVFDWWVSLHLVSKKRWMNINQTLIHYRIHDNQESQVMSENRKRFEAMLMLSDFLDRTEQKIELQQDEHPPLQFLGLGSTTPIYGDTFFGGFILWRFLSLFGEKTVDSFSKIDKEILEWGRLFGVPLISNELPSRATRKSNQLPMLTNFYFALGDDCCEVVKTVYRDFDFTSENDAIVLKCLHAASSQSFDSSIVIDCNHLSTLSGKRQKMEFVVKKVLESSLSNQSRFSLSSREKQIIKMIRDMKNLLRRIKRTFS